jgi:hypothetical protein
MTVANISTEALIDRIDGMRKQEETSYSYFRCCSELEREAGNRLNVAWREKICAWSYSVVDHFDLSREMVAISMNLFDRFMATRGNKCTGNMALLTSLTTLHLAIKLHDTKKIKISTLANLSRGQFGPAHIEEMEMVILNALGWAVHPPTAYSFIAHLLLFLPQEAPTTVRKDLYELSRYLSELTVCDSFFVDHNASTIAFSSILNVMEDMSYSKLSAGLREKFLRDLSTKVGFNFHDPSVSAARERIRAMVSTSMGFVDTNKPATKSKGCVDDCVSVTSTGSTGSWATMRRGSASSVGSMGSCRYSPSPRTHRCHIVSPITSSRGRSSSPFISAVQ